MIGIPDDVSGEVPKAFVVKSVASSQIETRQVIREINKHVEEHKARYKWLKGGIEFVDTIPKNGSGKILRRFLRDKERAKQENARASL